MAREKKKKSNRLSILVVRPKGGAATFTVSPFLLILLILFLVVFIAASIVIMNRYFTLYLENYDLKKAHKSATEELFRLQNLYSYQAMVSRDYASYVKGGADEKSTLDEQFIPLGSLPLEYDVEALDLLDAWASFFPDPAASEDHALDIDGFEVQNGDFNFRLLNEADGRTAGGHLLLLFTALYPGDNQLTLLPYPDFDSQNREPDFEAGLSYSIRSSKSVSGRLELPVGTRVVEMMAVARSDDGQIVLKKKLAPAE